MSKREAILERAVEVASEEGLEGLTIGRLSSELGLSKSGLFGHFGSKEELQLATVDAAGAVFVREVVEPALSEPEGAPRLRAFCEHWIGYLEREVFAGGCFFSAASTEFDGRPGPVRDKLRDGQQALMRELAKQAKLAGVEEPDQLVFEVYSLIQGTNAQYQLLRERQVFARARRAIDRLLLA
ncbi:MAG TPA: TetR/AcrR family transcriptional regulator [Thermoleophilaceae bacterium]|nr:TetR/AcrR family transcriptional regulator [Thermoleophilaceae bacterium]